MNQALAAALFTFLGIAITQVIGYMASKTKNSQDYDTVTRGELRNEVQLLREEIARVRTESELWQKKYYDLYGQHVALQAEHTALQKDYSELKVFLKEQGISVPGIMGGVSKSTFASTGESVASNKNE